MSGGVRGASAGSIESLSRHARPFAGLIGLTAAWQLAISVSDQSLLPGPAAALAAIVEMTSDGDLVRHTIASLFRVAWGYIGAAILAIPLGLVLGWYSKAERAAGPILQILRPISPLAWIPIAILWVGVGDLSAIFIIFLSVLWPLTTSAVEAAQSIPLKFVRAGRNFGLSRRALLFTVIYPAALPQLVLGLRLSLGIAWLVVVAAEMIAVGSGLGFFIIDARNAGNRYDQVVAGMLLIGLIGVVLDAAMRRLERSRALAWSYNRLSEVPKKAAAAANGRRGEAP